MSWQQPSRGAAPPAPGISEAHLDVGPAACQTATCRPAPPLLTNQHSEGSERQGDGLTAATQTSQRKGNPTCCLPGCATGDASWAHRPSSQGRRCTSCTAWHAILFRARLPRARLSGKGTLTPGCVPKLTPHTQVHTHPADLQAHTHRCTLTPAHLHAHTCVHSSLRPAGTDPTSVHAFLHTCRHTPTGANSLLDTCTHTHPYRTSGTH